MSSAAIAAAPAGSSADCPNGVPGYDVVLDLDRGTLRVRSCGLWSISLTDRFLAEMDRVLDDFALSGAPRRSLLTMIDLRRHSIQSRDTIARIQPQVERYHQLSKRTAVLLAPSALAKLQAERLLKVNRHRFFVSERAAQEWLLSGDDVAEAA